MHNIIISFDHDRLKEYLKKESNAGYKYILVDYNLIHIGDLLEKKGYEKVYINEGISNIDFKKEYLDFIGRLNRGYNSIYWWSNSISYKGAFVTDLPNLVYNYFCVISFIGKKDSNYIIISNNVILNDCIRKYCQKDHINCISIGVIKRESYITHIRRCCLSIFRFLREGWMRKMLSSIYLSRNIERSIKKDKSYYIIKSWIDNRSFSNGFGYKDLFFGRFPEYLRDKQKEFIILAGILTSYRDSILKIRKIKEYLIIPQEYFIGYLDYLKVIMLTFINRPKISRPLRFCGLEVTDLVVKCLKRDYENGEINSNFVHYYYIKGLLKRVKSPNTFIFTLENRAWERVSMLAFRKYSPLTKIIGYAHTSIRSSWLGYFYSKEEEQVIPLPDRIISIGMEPKLILEAGGSYVEKVNIEAGCALRYEYIFKRKPFSRNRNGSILAAFSIDMASSLKLLKFLQNSLQHRPGARVVLRPHPFTPIEAIIKRYNISLPPNFQISEEKDFEEELKRTSLIVYTDTTSSIEAVMCGIPAICVDFKEPVNPDPLFKVNSFKWDVSGKDELCRTIDYIYTMGDDEYLSRYKEAMEYLKRYFYPVEDRYLEKFIAD